MGIVALVRSNCIHREQQILSEATTLAEEGFNVVAVGWDRDGNLPATKRLNAKTTLLLMKKKAPCGSPMIFLYLPFFWFFVVIKLFSIRPDIVHAYDFDSAIPVYLYTKLNRGVRFVFEIYDRYAMAFIPPRYKTTYEIVNFLEELLSSKADLLIVVAERILTSMKRFRPKNFEVVMSCVSKDLITQVTSEFDEKSGMGPTGNSITLGYMGSVDTRLNDVLKVINRQTRLIVTGHVTDLAVLESLESMPNASWVGFLPYKEYLRMINNKVDVVLALYDPTVPKNELVYPNKLWESMALGKPIIANIGRDIVEETHCGIIVEYDPSDVKNAIEEFQTNPKAIVEMGRNGRHFFEEKYNWEMMKKRLVRAYSKLKSSAA